jgi:hypothetical protein
MAGELVRDNAAVLEAKLGRATGAVDHYLAHFLGAGGATRFLSALERTPGQAAAAVVPAAAAANRSVFYAKDGHALSLAEVRDRLAARLARAGASDAVLPVSGKRLPVVAAREAAAPAPVGADAGVAAGAARARMAYMLLAELGG